MCSCHECIYVEIDLYDHHYCNCKESLCYGYNIQEDSSCECGVRAFPEK